MSSTQQHGKIHPGDFHLCNWWLNHTQTGLINGMLCPGLVLLLLTVDLL